MPSPFPGMDPYLEGELWTTVHSQLAPEIARLLAPIIAPRYVARTEKRFVVSSPEEMDDEEITIFADVGVQTAQATRTGKRLAVREKLEAPLRMPTLISEKTPHYWVELRDVKHKTLVTAIEILSPSNKRGEGRSEYIRKRNGLLASPAHLLEIDLLRRGKRLPMRRKLPETEYFVFLSRAAQRPMTDIWPLRLEDTLPEIPVPLLSDDNDVSIDLQQALTNVYDGLRYDLDIDYRQPPDVPFTEEQAVRAAKIHRAK